MSESPESDNQRTAPINEVSRRGRRRLLGAVTLAAMLVVFLPMVLDSDPPKEGKPVALNIPAREGLPALPTPKPDDAKPKPAEVEPAKPVVTVPPSAPAKAEAKPGVAKTEATRSEAAKSETPKVEAPKTDTPKNDSAKPLATKVNADKAAASKPDAVKTDAAAPKPESFGIQLGAFSDQDKVKQMLAKMREAGVPAFTEAAGNLTRVRAGPFKSRLDAEAALPRVKLAGVDEAKVVPLP